MKALVRAMLILVLAGTAAYAQTPDGQRRGPPDNSRGRGGIGATRGQAPAASPAPATAMRGQPARPAPATAMRSQAQAPNRPAPAMAMRGQPNRSGSASFAGSHHLPPGIARPAVHHRAPVWRGRSWAIGDLFVFAGFNGPTIRGWMDYGLVPPRPGTHWIYVDGFFLMVGNRTGRIFAEVAADY